MHRHIDGGPDGTKRVRTGPDTARPRCNQDTRRGEQCLNPATWSETNKRTGERELYCTRHANVYMPWRRGGERVREGS